MNKPNELKGVLVQKHCGSSVQHVHIIYVSIIQTFR